MKKIFYAAIAALAIAACGKGEQPQDPSTPEQSGSDAVTGVRLFPEAVELSIGKTVQLEAVVEPETAANKSVIWSTSNDKVATVKDGVVTATGDGEATIKVTTVDGYMTATCKVSVSTIYVSEISVPETSVSLVIGSDYQIKPTIKPDNAENAAISFKVVSGDAVSVSSEGLVSAVKVGSATVRVEAMDGKGAKADVKFTVQSEPIYATGFIIACDVDTQIGKTVNGRLNWEPSGTNQKGFEITSSDPSVAKLTVTSDESFTLEGLKEGSTNIHVSYKHKPGIFKNFKFTVHKDAPSIQWTCDWKTSYGSLTTDPMIPGETYQLKAAVNNIGSTGVTYAITSGSDYATVSSSGVLTAKKRGTVKVIAKSATNPNVKTPEQTIQITYPADKIVHAYASGGDTYWNDGDNLTYYVKRGSDLNVTLGVQSSDGYSSRPTLELESLSSSISSIVTVTRTGYNNSGVQFKISAKTGSYAVKGTATFRVTGTTKTRTVNVYVCEYEYFDVKPGDALWFRQSDGALTITDGHYRGKTSNNELIWYKHLIGSSSGSVHAVVTWVGLPGESDSQIRDWATYGGSFSCTRSVKNEVHGYAIAVKNTSSSTTTWAKETQNLFGSEAFIEGKDNYRGCPISQANALDLTKKYGYDLTLGGIAYNYNRGDSHHISVIHHLYRCDRGSSEGNSGFEAFNDTYTALPMDKSPKNAATAWYNAHSSGWFLPSEAEWKECILGTFGMNVLNSLLDKYSGVQLSSVQPYWTMQQDPNNDKQVRIVLGDKGMSGSYVSKTSAHAMVRPIIVF